MKSFKFQRLFVLLFLVPTVSSLIITSVYAGKKKFKTFSLGTPLFPSVVKVEPNKFHLTFRQYKYLRTPQFKIEGTLPLKAPTVVREKFKVHPIPEVSEYNFGELLATVPEDNQPVTYDGTQNMPVFNEPPKDTTTPEVSLQSSLQSSTEWKPSYSHNPVQFNGPPNYYPSHHRVKRFANEYSNRFDPNLRTFSQNGPNFGSNYENRQSFPNYMSSHLGANSHSYVSPPNYQNYFKANVRPYAVNSNIETPGQYQNSYSAQTHPTYQFNGNPTAYHSNHDMTASSSSLAPPKYERYFNPTNQQNNKWIPMVSPSMPSVTQTTSSDHSNSFSDQNQKKVNIGEHYNPSASYVDEKMAEKPTYDPDESDEGSVSFSISGPHGGEEVPAGYEAKIKEMHEALKENPMHIPPGLDQSQIVKYYNQHTFTEPLKNNYGYKPAFGPFELLKSKLKSWKHIL